MKIVLLEGLGVSEEIIRKQTKKLNEMGHEFVIYEKNTDPRVQAERCEDADIIMLANMPLSREAIERASHLQYIDVAFTGVDHIPMDEAGKRGIAVSNASGYATQAVAELCISFMIQLLRNVKQTEQRCREGGTKDGLIGNLLCGKTVGIIGAGAIGKRTAELCKAFGCKVIAYSRSRVEHPAIDRQVTLEELLKEADIVSLHCPLTEETRGMIGEEQLRMMKKTAVLINTARGPVADSEALAKALTEGRIAGAACDVFETEPPLDAEHPLLHTPNTIVTPHIAFASEESMEQRADIVFENLYAWLEGKQLNKVEI
ncbi:2-hydroxyacid dehydrogenase [Anaerostipes sp.]|uniref:2-hydroxyacid dehydrogenase n=1 Tax=Anaerostipes sp. TaxID=1872530 RepID=UPI00257B6A1B|nr:2-hydroxyacid dehydrogenase [Anaerostipes sp.]